MSTPRHYRRKPLTVAALQWTGENHAEMKRFLGEHFSYGPDAQADGGAAVLSSQDLKWKPLPVMAWAVIGPGSAVSVMEEHELRLDYTAVG